MNLESILRQDDWLRRMARGMVSDPELAADLVQDVWVADLEGSERVRERRGWLRGVLANAGSKAFRRRRIDRERALDHGRTLDESAPATDDVAAERQIRRRVGRELFALHEHEREALLLLYVADLPLKEAAERMGVAPSTARKRAANGLRTLRARLDRSFGEGRSAWSSALTSFAPKTLAKVPSRIRCAATWPVLGMSAGAALVSLVAFHAAPRIANLAPLEGVPVGPERAMGTPPVEPRHPSNELERELASVESRSAARAEVPATVSSAQEDEPSLARISVRLLGPDGMPATGARWQLSGAPAKTDLGRRHGHAADWEDLEGEIGEDGRLEIRFDPPPGYTFGLEVTLPGCAKTRWHFWKMSASTEKSFGTVRLQPECKIVGRIVDAHGNGLGDHSWRVWASEVDRPGTDGRIEASTRVDVLEGQSTFEVGGLSAGLVELSLSPDATRLSERYRLILENGPPLERDFECDPERAADLRPRIHVNAINYGLSAVSPDCITAVDRNGDEIPVATNARFASVPVPNEACES